MYGEAFCTFNLSFYECFLCSIGRLREINKAWTVPTDLRILFFIFIFYTRSKSLILSPFPFFFQFSSFQNFEESTGNNLSTFFFCGSFWYCFLFLFFCTVEATQQIILFFFKCKPRKKMDSKVAHGKNRSSLVFWSHQGTPLQGFFLYFKTHFLGFTMLDTERLRVIFTKPSTITV